MSRRNNLERLGAADQDAPTPPTAVTQQDTSDIFSFITPTEFVDLPSKGLLYPEGHALYQTSTVEIRHMTAKEEDILTSESLIKKGVALDRLVHSIVVDKKIRPEDLLIGDKNALLVAARVTGFGNLYETKITCPSCTKVTDVSLDLEDLQTKDFEELPENVTTTDQGTYVITLPDFNNLEVEVRLLTGRHEKFLMQQREKRRKLKLPDTNITDQLTAIIARVNEITDPALLAQFTEQVPTRVSRQIRAIYEDLVPDLDMTFGFECDNCGHVGKVGMPISADFFWPDT